MSDYISTISTTSSFSGYDCVLSVNGTIVEGAQSIEVDEIKKTIAIKTVFFYNPSDCNNVPERMKKGKYFTEYYANELDSRMKRDFIAKKYLGKITKTDIDSPVITIIYEYELESVGEYETFDTFIKKGQISHYTDGKRNIIKANCTADTMATREGVIIANVKELNYVTSTDESSIKVTGNITFCDIDDNFYKYNGKGLLLPFDIRICHDNNESIVIKNVELIADSPEDYNIEANKAFTFIAEDIKK